MVLDAKAASTANKTTEINRRLTLYPVPDKLLLIFCQTVAITP
jgi:hypothetical protein